MTSHDERAHIKRAMGIGEYAGGEWETVLGETKYSIFAHGQKYNVHRGGGEFCTWIPSMGRPICADSLDELRDKVIEALEAPKLEEGQLVYIHGLGMVKVTFPAPSAPRAAP